MLSLLSDYYLHIKLFASLSKDKTNSPIHFKVGVQCAPGNTGALNYCMHDPVLNAYIVYNNLYSHISLHVHRVYNVLPVELHYET